MQYGFINKGYVNFRFKQYHDIHMIYTVDIHDVDIHCMLIILSLEKFIYVYM